MAGYSYIDERTKKSRYQSIAGAMKQDRSTFEPEWQTIADYFNPKRIRMSREQRNQGGRRDQKIINSEGRFAARTLASGMHAGLTSPARPWMKLTVPDQNLAKFKPVAIWLREVTERMLTVFAVSNLYNILPIVYGDMGLYATGLISILDDRKDLFRCYSYPVGSYWLGLDGRGLVTSVYREYQLTVRQIVEQFGLKANGRDIDWSHISNAVKAQWEKGLYEQPVNVCWLVKPNELADGTRFLSKYLPWSSCHWEEGDGDVFLKESGYNEFPFMAPRWEITGEDTYGTDCPGMTAIGDNRQLQLMERKKAQAINKMVDPPMVGPSSLRTQKTSILSGDITYEDSREGQKGFRPAHEVAFRIDHLVLDEGRVEDRIRRAFFADLFLMLANSDRIRGAQPPTAREIDERHEEKLLALGPVLEQTNDELLDPLVDRTFNMMVRANMLPPPPPDLEGVDLTVEYTSILAQAQKLVGVVGQDRLLQTIIPLAEINPEVVDKIDFAQAIDNYGEMLGVDPRVIRSTDEARAMGAARAKAAAQQAQAEQAKLMAGAAKDLSQAPVGTDSALDRVAGAAAAAGGQQVGAA